MWTILLFREIPWILRIPEAKHFITKKKKNKEMKKKNKNRFFRQAERGFDFITQTPNKMLNS